MEVLARFDEERKLPPYTIICIHYPTAETCAGDAQRHALIYIWKCYSGKTPTYAKMVAVRTSYLSRKLVHEEK